MSVLLQNKHVSVGENEYRLTIEKKRLQYTGIIGYMAYLSDVNSQYSNEIAFDSVHALKNRLRDWIKSADSLNNPETAVFQQLKDWDGVIHIE